MHFLQVLISSLNCLCLLWLPRVISLVCIYLSHSNLDAYVVVQIFLWLENFQTKEKSKAQHLFQVRDIFRFWWFKIYVNCNEPAVDHVYLLTGVEDSMFWWRVHGRSVWSHAQKVRLYISYYHFNHLTPKSAQNQNSRKIPDFVL